MKHLAMLSLAACGLAAAHANERGNAAPSGCENVQSAAASVQTQRTVRSAPQSPSALVTHGAGQVIHNTGQVVHRGGSVIHNTGQVAHNTPLLNRPVTTYGAANMQQPCAPGG